VSKKTLDTSYAQGQRKQARIFENSSDGWKQMLSWLKANAPQARVIVVANKVQSSFAEISRTDFEASIETGPGSASKWRRCPTTGAVTSGP